MREGEVLSPNLPKSHPRAVIIGERYERVLRAPLEALGLRVLLCPSNPVVDPRLAGHADLSLLHLGGEKILVSRHVASEGFLAELEALGMESLICEGPRGESYPLDAAMCACLVGGRVFHDPKISCPELLEAAGDRLIPVRQGYAGCAMCPVDESSAITSDAGITAAAERAGMDVLLISPGHIELEGYDYGFIGGSAFCLSESALVFTGSLHRHPDRDRIFDFLRLRGKSPLFLTERPVFDVGSIIPI